MRKIVTLCGSSTFIEDFWKIKTILESDGDMVLMPETFVSSEGLTVKTMDETQIKKIHLLHESKMRISDYVYFVNKNKYMGEDTLRELKFCMDNHIPVVFMEPLDTDKLH